MDCTVHIFLEESPYMDCTVHICLVESAYTVYGPHSPCICGRKSYMSCESRNIDPNPKPISQKPNPKTYIQKANPKPISQKPNPKPIPHKPNPKPTSMPMYSALPM